MIIDYNHNKLQQLYIVIIKKTKLKQENKTNLIIFLI